MLFFSVLDCLSIALGIMILGFFFGVPALAFLNALFGVLRKRVFMTKLARQLARLGLLIIIAVAVLSSGALLGCIYLAPEAGIWLEHRAFWEAALYVCLAALFFFAIYCFTWNKLSSFQPLHIVLGATGVAGSKIFLGLILWSMWRELETVSPVHPGPDSIFWPVLVQIYLLSLAAGSCLGMIYLIYRRRLDDFGRDYYRFALKCTAKWGIFFTAVSPLTCIWAFLVGRDFFYPTYMILPGIGYAALLVILILALLRIARSTQPMRHKLAVFLCPFLVWLVFTVRLVSYLEMGDMVVEEEVVSTFMSGWQEQISSL